MKSKYLLSACILASSLTTQSIAQSNSSSFERLQDILYRLEHKAPHHAAYYQRVVPAVNAANAANKTTQTVSRLKSYVYKEYDNSFINRDTTAFNYTGFRTGEWMGDMNYDSYVMWQYDNAGMIYDYFENGTQTFDSNDHRVDRLIKRWNAQTSIYVNHENYTNTYDSLARLKTQREQHWDNGAWANDSLFEFTYDTLGRVERLEGKIWNASANSWKQRDRYTYTYDPAGQMIRETYQIWDTALVNWRNISRYNYLYNNNKLVTADFDTFSHGNNAWENTVLYEYSYDGNGDNTSMLVKNWNAGLNGYENAMKYNYTYDGNHNALSETVQNWDGGSASFLNDTRTQFTYNSFDQPLTIVNDTWDGSAWAYDNNSATYNLYYEVETSDIKEVAEDSRVLVYPSPASNYIKVDLEWKNTQNVSLAIFDAQGRILKQQIGSGQQFTIPVSDLPTGNYWIRIAGQNGNVVKQVLVTH